MSGFHKIIDVGSVNLGGNVIWRGKCFLSLVLGFFLFIYPVGLTADDAREVLKRLAKQNFGASFRGVLSTTTLKGNKAGSTYVMWIMGKSQPDMTSIFIAIEEPEEQKGFRYLFEFRRDKDLNGFMWDPASKKIINIEPQNPLTTLAGSGLTVEDIQGIIPRRGEEETLLRREKIGDRECMVILISRPEEKAGRLLWIDDKNNVVVKTQNLDAHGNVSREMKVTKFFRSENGKEIPREEEITVPGDDVRIKVVQEHGLFDVEIPPELMDPEQFGQYKMGL